MKATLFIIRHGETSANKDRIIQGSSDYPLNDHGRLQARKAGLALKEERFHSVIASDLSRAFETACIIIQNNEKCANEPIQKWKSLRERCFGTMEGHSNNEYMEEAIKFKAQNPSHQPWYYTPEGGETVDELAIRAGKTYQALVDEARRIVKSGVAPQILVVSHGGFIAALMRHLAQTEKCGMPSGRYKECPPNTAITKIGITFSKSLDIQKLKCEELYNADHLESTSICQPNY